MKKNLIAEPILSEEDQMFLKIVHDPSLRAALLERLQALGLLDAFLQVESETKQGPAGLLGIKAFLSLVSCRQDSSFHDLS